MNIPRTFTAVALAIALGTAACGGQARTVTITHSTASVQQSKPRPQPAKRTQTTSTTSTAISAKASYTCANDPAHPEQCHPSVPGRCPAGYVLVADNSVCGMSGSNEDVVCTPDSQIPGDCIPQTRGKCPTGYVPNADGGVLCIGPQPPASSSPRNSEPNCTSGSYVGTFDQSANNGFGGCSYTFPNGETIVGPPNAVLDLATRGYWNCGGFYWSNGSFEQPQSCSAPMVPSSGSP